MASEGEIKALSRDVISASQGMLVIEWRLSQRVEAEWLKFLSASGVTKSGSMVFLQSEPYLVGNGDTLRLNVPDADLESAVKWIEQSIPIANQKFDAQVLAPRRRLVAKTNAQQVAEEQSLQAARERLKQIG